VRARAVRAKDAGAEAIEKRDENATMTHSSSFAHACLLARTPPAGRARARTLSRRVGLQRVEFVIRACEVFPETGKSFDDTDEGLVGGELGDRDELVRGRFHVGDMALEPPGGRRGTREGPGGRDDDRPHDGIEKLDKLLRLHT
jgi:hypothetical protein